MKNWLLYLREFKGEKSVAKICREHQISQNRYYRWRDKFLEGGKNALTFGAPSKKETYLKSRN